MTVIDANKKRTKTKRKGNKTWVKGGPSPNPKGAPKRGQSWSEIIKEIGEMTPDEARAMCAQIFQKITLHDEVTLKQAVVMRSYAALLFDPQPGILNAFMDRADGKVKEQIEHSGEITTTVKKYVTVSPDEWDTGSSDVQPPAVADSTVEGQESDPAANG